MTDGAEVCLAASEVKSKKAKVKSLKNKQDKGQKKKVGAERRPRSKHRGKKREHNLQIYMRGFIYIMTNDNNTVLYTGVTSNLKVRVKEHEEKLHAGSFTSRYNVRKLVYYECFNSIGQAIKREKQIKAGSRKKKLDLINVSNPERRDLTIDLDD